MKFLEWFATIVTLCGAVLTSFHYDPYNVYLLNFGSLLWIIWASLEKRMSIVVVNFGMMLIYALGTMERLGWVDFSSRI